MQTWNPNYVRHGAGYAFLVPYIKFPGTSVGSVTVGTPGSGYTSAPTVTFSGGGSGVIRQAQGYAVLATNTVGSVVITDPGEGYTSAPTIAFTGGGGTLAAATAVLGNPAGPLVYTAPPAVPALSDLFAGYFQRFYVDPVQRRVLNNAMKSWANLDESGLNLKMKLNPVTYPPMNGPKQVAGFNDLEAIGELTFSDVDPGHLQDAFSASASELLSIAASAGKAARQSILLGSQRLPQRYTLLYRMQSPNYPGEFDHTLIPRCVVVPEFDKKMGAKDMVTGKIKIYAEADPFLQSPVNGEFAVVIEETANGFAL